MTAVENSGPPADRLPRRGDKVVPAPHNTIDAPGEVIAYSSRRIHVRTAIGISILPLSRFTWKPKKRVWVCWPADVVTSVRKLTERELRADFAPRPADAQVGDQVVVSRIGAGIIGWITRTLASGVLLSASEGMMMNALSGYIVSTAKGRLRFNREELMYDSALESWIATAAGAPTS